MKIPSSLALECTLKKVPASLSDGTIQKTLSVSATNAKRFVINDHYEFDQKVNFIIFCYFGIHLTPLQIQCQKRMQTVSS